MRMSTLIRCDHDAAVPVYRQLPRCSGRRSVTANCSRQAAAVGVKPEGEHGVSRNTVRHAVGILRDEGLVLTVQGKGSYVAEH